MEKWKRVRCATGTLILPVGKGKRASFPLKNILPKKERDWKRQRGEQWRDRGEEGGTHFFGRVHPRVQLPYRSHPPRRSQPAPEQRKAPSKPVSRVSQSRVKQLSAFAPSLEREKASGHQPDRNVQALQIHRGG